MASKSWTYEINDMRADCADAFMRARVYHAELQEICEYYMPHRLPTFDRSGDNGKIAEGAKRTSKLFDGTALVAAASFASNMQADWMPMFDNFFKLENGPLWPGDDDEKAQRDRGLQAVTGLAHALMPRVRLAANELFYDLLGGTGAMFLTPGDRSRNPLMASVAPLFEIAMDNGADGQVERWWWKRRHRNRHIDQLWGGDVEIGDKLASRIRNERNGMTDVVQYTYWNPREKRFDFLAWAEGCDGDKPLKTDQMRVSPWVTPRFRVAPGEIFGRGLAHDALPFVKTLNKARELALRAAAFALLGIWMHRHDGVFNPDTAVMAPGAMWKVASTGGARGASIERLPIPQNFDVSSVVISDERDQVRRVMLDADLPELKDTVRSPTEIAARLRRYERDRGGATVRLSLELIAPLAMRSIDIIEDLGLLPTKLEIDQILTMATVTAPAAAAQKTGHVERTVSWMTMVMQLFGQQALTLTADVERIIPQLGRWLGIEEQWIRSNVDKKAFQRAIAEAIAALETQNKQQAAAEAAPQPQPAAHAAYMNGGF